MRTKFWLEILKGRDHSDECTRCIKMDLTEIVLEGVDWIHLGQGRDRWRAVVNTVMNIRIS
jgi:hypothetical protein